MVPIPVEGYAVRVGGFEGPLDLLLALIERRELDVSTVSLAAVTDQYLAYVNSGMPLDLVADYLRIAARLILIKSSLLLPRPAVAVVEDEPIDDAELLARQLIEYRRFKLAAGWLRDREEAGLRSWPRRVPPTVGVRPLAPIGLDRLALAMVAIGRRVPPVDDSVEPAPRIALADRIVEVEYALRRRSATLRSLLPGDPTVDLIVVTFLAILELFKRGRITVDQPDRFGEIRLDWRQ